MAGTQAARPRRPRSSSARLPYRAARREPKRIGWRSRFTPRKIVATSPSALVLRVKRQAVADDLGNQVPFAVGGVKCSDFRNPAQSTDTDPAALDKFERNAASLGLYVHRASSAKEAATGAEIITTCTADKALATVLTQDVIATGIHINAIGGDCLGKTELDAAILRRANVFIEFEDQTRIEGEIQQLDPEHPVTELWQVLTGEAPGRTSPEQITVFDSVGFAIPGRSRVISMTT